MGYEISLASLIGLVAAGDEVNGDSSATGEVIQGGGHPSQEHRLYESRTMGDQYLQMVGLVEHGGGNRPDLLVHRSVAHEDTVKTGLLMGAGDVDQIVGIDNRSVHPVDHRAVDQRALDLRRIPRPHHADDFDGHELDPFVVAARFPTSRAMGHFDGELPAQG